MESSFKIIGSPEISVYQRGILVDKMIFENIVLNTGKAFTVNRMAKTNGEIIARMAIGDMGTVPSDPTVPRIPTVDDTELYHEIYRQDVQSVNVVTVGSQNEATFTSIFRAVDIPSTAYINPATPAVNEVGLVVVDTLVIPPMPRSPVASPDPQHPGEYIFSLKTFKSIPFEAANETTISVKYTVTII